MKKIYESPAIQVVKLELQQIMTASESVGMGGSYGGGTIESRDYDDWDD